MRQFMLFLSVVLFPVSIWGQEVTFQGHVQDAETGERLPYVNISSAEGKRTLSNNNGDFKLTVDENSAVTFSCIGYEKKTIQAGSEPRTVRLTPYTSSLKEVLVGPVNYDEVLKRTIDNLKQDYRKHGKLARTYFFRTLMEKAEGTYIAEAFMNAYSVVNIRSANIVSGLQSSDTNGAGGTLNVNASNIHRLIEVGPMTIDSRFWSSAQKPLQHYSYTHEHYDAEFQHLFGEDGESLYRIEFSLKEKYRSEYTTQPYIVGTAYVDTETCQLLRFDGSCINYFMKNELLRYPTSIEFHLEYDYSRGFASVMNLAVNGDNALMLYHALLFALEEDKQQTDKIEGSGSNIVTALKDAGFDVKLWDEYDIVKRTEEEERVAFGDSLQSQPSLLPIFLEEEKKKAKSLHFPETFRPLMDRLMAFGKTIPQEKVFVHMDNTSYQLGDTIWFTAYTRQTDTDKPSDVSGVLYVELYGQEGYMIERKLIQMKEGRGSGFFALTGQVQYAGFYELRAYTRWQLNWGLFEHKHTDKLNFGSKRQEKEYYRDYEKLYSRVFPVYDKPIIPGEFNHDMTLRAMRRIYNAEPEKREIKLTLYPEGGNLVAGVENRVAFEAVLSDGEQVEGILSVGEEKAKTINRGRGMFTIVPEKLMEREVTFLSADGEKASARLPKPEEDGVSIKVLQEGDSIIIETNLVGLNADSMALTIMHEGKPEEFHALSESLNMKTGGFPAGIHQVTVFDIRGRIWADRLFFVRKPMQEESTLMVEGMKNDYQPYESINLKLKISPSAPTRVDWGGGFSLAVRDGNQADPLFDNGNIMTEMLLSSEIKGFIPNPGWYFEKDDEEHRQALDLLMMTQGWRRFVWQDMVLKGAWDLTQPAEKAPILIGNTFKNVNTDDMFLDEEEILQEENHEEETDPMDLSGFHKEKNSKSSEKRAREETEYKRAVNKKEQNKADRKELRVHAEIVAVDADTSFVGEVETDRSAFRIQLPPFYGPSVIFISVADTTKWKKKKSYTWIQAAPDDEETDYMFLPASRKLRRKIFVEPADYLARISWPYPRFVKPYSFYQDHLAPAQFPQAGKEEVSPKRDSEETAIMREVTVKAKRNRLRKFDDTWPILVIDALEANNIAKDYGLGFMQVMVGDYGVGAPNNDGGIKGEQTFETRYGYGRTRRMLMDKEIPQDSIYARKYLISGSFKLTPPSLGPTGIGEFGSENSGLSPGESMEYLGTGVWDKYVLYSDYSPRMEGSKQYYGANEPKTKLVMYPFPDGSRRITYRDRRYIFDGFSYPAEFYSPDYSRQTPPEPTDYRRTLYWNPYLQLDKNGEVNITFYNNSRQTSLSVEAEGQAPDGTLLWVK